MADHDPLGGPEEATAAVRAGTWPAPGAADVFEPVALVGTVSAIRRNAAGEIVGSAATFMQITIHAAHFADIAGVIERHWGAVTDATLALDDATDQSVMSREEILAHREQSERE